MTLISRLIFFKGKKKTVQKSSGNIRIDEVSIVIPVKNNQQGINNYLDHFFLTHRPEIYPREIIVVDNNSKPSLRIFERYLETGLVKPILCTIPGPAAARNLGALNATGKWLLFNDSDCIPTNSLLTGYIKGENGSVGYAGNIKSVGRGALSRYYESQEILLPLKTLSETGVFVPQYLITANTLVWKSSFMEIGGFNEDITIAGGEDVDFGLRLSQIGRLSYAFESLLLHDFNDGLIGFYKRFKRYGRGNKIVEKLWQTNMKPTPFRPNKKCIINEFFALLQYLFLLHGYQSQEEDTRQFKVGNNFHRP